MLFSKNIYYYSSKYSNEIFFCQLKFELWYFYDSKTSKMRRIRRSDLSSPQGCVIYRHHNQPWPKAGHSIFTNKIGLNLMNQFYRHPFSEIRRSFRQH